MPIPGDTKVFNFDECPLTYYYYYFLKFVVPHFGVIVKKPLSHLFELTMFYLWMNISHTFYMSPYFFDLLLDQGEKKNQPTKLHASKAY